MRGSSGPNGHSIFAGVFLNALTAISDGGFRADELFNDRARERFAGASGQLPQSAIVRNSDHEDGYLIFIRGPQRRRDISWNYAPSSAGVMVDYPEIPSVRLPLMFQNWLRLTFLHWRAEASAISPLLPDSLKVDSCDGSGWVGIAAFLLSGLRPPFGPAMPWISKFPETNCRTYVIGPDGRAGVWFFSLDAARWSAVLGGRAAYGLPYKWSSMRVGVASRRLRYESRRISGARAETDIEVEAGDPIEPSALEVFLTARFRLFSTIRGRLACADVEHEPWPLHRAALLRCEQTLTQAAGIKLETVTPLLHFSPGVTVRIGRPKLLRGGR